MFLFIMSLFQACETPIAQVECLANEMEVVVMPLVLRSSFANVEPLPAEMEVTWVSVANEL